MLDYILGFASLYFLTYLLITYLEEERDDPPCIEKPSVTVLIPAYNESKTIERTVESALGLDYPDVEVIVIDDGSVDDTAARAERMGIKVIRQQNTGKAGAVNNGLRHARGDLIATLDADSFVAPDALDHMVGFFSDPMVMAVTPTMKVMEKKGTLIQMQKAEYLFSNIMSKTFSFLDSVVVTPGPFSVYRSSVFKEIGGFDGSTLTEDNEMALRIQSRDYLIRSSRGAFVYTKVPESLDALLRQRKRWYIGYLQNLRKYIWLIKPGFGELGLFVLPLSIILLVLSMSKIAADTGGLVGGVLQGTLPVGTSAFIKPYEFMGEVSFAMGLVLFLLSIYESREAPSLSIVLHLLLMMALSPFLYAYAFIMKAVEILTGRSAKW